MNGTAEAVQEFIIVTNEITHDGYATRTLRDEKR